MRTTVTSRTWTRRSTATSARVIASAWAARPRMFDHVAIRVSDRAASEAFYDTVLSTLGLRQRAGENYTSWENFLVMPEGPANPAAQRLHIAWFADSRELVDAFHEAGVKAGYRSDGEPGPRPV